MGSVVVLEDERHGWATDTGGRGSHTRHDAGRHEVQRTGRTPALGVDEQFRVGLGLHTLAKVGTVDAGVDVALPQPDVHVVALQAALHVGAEELVGTEEGLLIAGDRFDDLDGVRRRTADVGLGLDLGVGPEPGQLAQARFRLAFRYRRSAKQIGNAARNGGRRRLRMMNCELGFGN